MEVGGAAQNYNKFSRQIVLNSNHTANKDMPRASKPLKYVKSRALIRFWCIRCAFLARSMTVDGLS